MICPVCLTKQANRKDNTCPECGTQVEIVNGEWVVSAPNSPNVRLLEYFEKMVSRQQSIARGLNINFKIPRKGMSYLRELSASKNVISRAGSLETALAAIHFLLTDEKFCWKSYTSLTMLFKDLPLALAIVEAKMEQARIREQGTQEVLRQIERRKNLIKH